MTFIGGLASLLFAQTRVAEEEAGRVYDAVVGIVTDIADPQQLCRVKVRFPSLGPDTTWGCPLVVPGAGKGRGWFTVPEVGDEVVETIRGGDAQHGGDDAPSGTAGCRQPCIYGPASPVAATPSPVTL